MSSYGISFSHEATKIKFDIKRPLYILIEVQCDFCRDFCKWHIDTV